MSSIDQLCGYSKETEQKEEDEQSLNELNVYYPTGSSFWIISRKISLSFRIISTLYDPVIK